MALATAMRTSRLVAAVCALSVSFACASAPPRKPITELFAAVHTPSYDFAPAQTPAPAPAPGYAVGIIDTAVVVASVPPGVFALVSELEKQYVSGFVAGVSAGLEKILMSKGLAVTGPFESYSEMTYPERSRCDFLVQPTVRITFQPAFSPVRRLDEYGGPNGEPWVLGARDVTLTAVAELQYVILDPLTQEKLERHRLKTDALVVDYREILWTDGTRDERGTVLAKVWRELWRDAAAFPGYHNGEGAAGELLNRLYAEFLPRIDALVSVGAFDQLKKYQDEIRQKKVH